MMLESHWKISGVDPLTPLTVLTQALQSVDGQPLASPAAENARPIRRAVPLKVEMSGLLADVSSILFFFRKFSKDMGADMPHVIVFLRSRSS